MCTGNELSWIYDDASDPIIKAEKDGRAMATTTLSRSLAERQRKGDARQEHVRETTPLTVNHALESVLRERKFAGPRNTPTRNAAATNESGISKSTSIIPCL